MPTRWEKELEALAAELVASGFTDKLAITRLVRKVAALPRGTPRPRGKYINMVIEALR